MPDVSLSGIEFTIKGGTDAASDSVRKLTEDLDNLKKVLKETKGVSSLANQLKRLENVNTVILSVAKFTLQEISKIDFSNLRVAADGIRDIAKAAREIANIGEKASEKVEKIVPRNLFQVLGSAASSMLKFSGAVAKFGAKNLGSIISKPFKTAAINAAGFVKSIGGVISGFKRIVGYRMIRTIIKEITQGFAEGIKNLYGWSTLVNGKFKTSMDMIATSMLYMKNSLGAMVAPIINALAPAIDFLVDKFVALLNVINQLLAKLTGAASWTRAKKKATEYGDAVGGAGKAAKEAMRYLAPFDELNVLPDQRDRGGSGGSGDDYSGMFEEVSEFSEGIADFADAVRDAISRADWQGLGELLGGKVNEIIDSINFAGLGQKVGFGINALFSTKYWTLKTINFQNIGKKIAEFLTGGDEGGGIFGEVDWNVVGRSLTQKMTILGDLIVGGLSNLDWGQITSSAGNVIKGAFSQVGDWVKSVNWSEFGSTMYQKVKDAITSVDWSGVGQAVFSCIGSVIGAGGAFLAEIAKGIWTDLKNYFMGFIRDENGNGTLDGGEILEGLLKGIGNAFKNIGTWVKNNIWTPFVNGIKSIFGINSPATTMIPYGEDIGEGIKNGIKSIFTGIRNWVKINILDKIQSAIDKGKEIAVKVKAKFGEWREEFNSWIGGLNDKDHTFDVTAKITKAIDKIPSAQKIINTVSNFVKRTFGTTFSKTIDTTANFIKRTIGSSFSTVFDATANFVKRILGINTTVDTTANFTTTKNSLPSKPEIPSKANLLSFGNSIKTTPSIDSQANLKTAVKSLNETPAVNSIANLVDAYDNIPYTPTINVVAVITEAYDNGQAYSQQTDKSGLYASGGAYYGGIRHKIPQAARGGRFHGTLLWAGESGPEVVGHAGGRTEVLNKSQLASTMYSSVIAAMSHALSSLSFSIPSPSVSDYANNDSGMSEDTLYAAFLRALNDANDNEVIELDGDVVYRKMVQRNRQNTRRTGVNAMVAF